MPEDSVRAVTGFLVDAARGEVSVHTVVQVLQHWVDEGVSHEELHAAVDHARQSVAKGGGNELGQRLARYEHAIRGGLDLSPSSDSS